MKKLLFLTFAVVLGISSAHAQTRVLQRDLSTAGSAQLFTSHKTQVKKIDPAANQIWWGYGTEIENRGGLGVRAAETHDVAIFVAPDNSAVVGKTIKAIRFYLRDKANTNNVKVWISKSLPDDISSADYVQDVDQSALKAGDESGKKQGLANLKDQKDYEPLYLAGLSRAIGDWLLGMNATRLYTLKYGNNRFGKNAQVLSIGRVQTPTLALIVERQKEIDNFKPEPYWVLATIYRDTQFTATKGKFTSKEEGQEAFALIENKPFEVTSVTKKKGTEQPKQLYDLTSLQVDCNRKFGYSAEMTLNTIQSLYERKYTTYPRVDTQHLTDDVYKECPQIMNALFQATFAAKKPYADLVKPLGGKPLPKSKRVFDSSKVTDHHAIIPTNVIPQGLNDAERNVYDLIARRFISVFYPDCKFSTTTVLGKVDEIEFKASGKEILDEGWRVVYKQNSEKQAIEEASDKNEAAEKTLPTFVKGEKGEHSPTLTEKQTVPPKHYTEASLLRAMETAGKLVDDEELRAALKENGIGRPSSRAGIIETLFKRNYIRRQRKNLIATETGIALIDTIHEKLLTSAELTGIWEKKLRDIEHKKYDAGQFINELKEQISNIVNDVLADNSNRKIGEATQGT